MLSTRRSVAEQRFRDFETLYGLSFPVDLRLLYGELDGYWPTDHNESQLPIPNHYLIPFEDAWQQFENSPFGGEHNRKEWILLSDQSGEIIYRRVTSLTENDATVYIRCLEAGITDWSLFDGVGEMFLTYAECLDSGIFENEDTKQETAIALRYNRRSQYWQHSAKILGVSE